MIFLPFNEIPGGPFNIQYDPERINFIRSLPGFMGFYGPGIKKVKIDYEGVLHSRGYPTLIRFDTDKNRMFAKLSI